MKKLNELKAKKAQLLREADALRTDGVFPNDEARTAFAAKVAEAEALDTEIRALEANPPAPEPPAPPPAAPTAAVQQAREQAIAEERQRGTAIRTAVSTFGLEASVGDDMIARGITLDAARGELFDRLATRSDQLPISSRFTFGEDARDKWLRGATNALLVRSGTAALVAKHEGTGVDKIDPGEFRGFSLLEMARETLERYGVKTRGLDRMSLAGMAMTYRSGNYQTTSDFAVLLENAMHKVLRAAYAMQADTWSKWCGIGTVSDFRAHNWYRTGELSIFDDLNEHGEFKNKPISDGEKTTYSAAPKGNIIAISRQTIVNDDIGFVMRLTDQLGRAGKRTIEVAVYTLLGQNSGLGPTQTDGQPLFHANRANVGTGAALSVDAIDADRVVMAQQKDPGLQDFLDLRPAVLLVAVGLGGRAREVNAQEYNDESNKQQRRPNVVRGLFNDVVDTPRLSGTRRYLFADPASAPVFLVSFLEGQREPVLETKDGWRVDGVEMRGRLDVGVNVVDFRGAVTNAGA